MESIAKTLSNSLSASAAPPPAGFNCSVIAHIDLDCFYVQVERSLNENLKNKPVAVVQYNPFGDLKSLPPSDDRLVERGSIIAVSYEARARGVKRIMRGGEAKKACPDIFLVQVPTSHGKADLSIYRDASARILSVLGERFPSVVIERASIDEVYLDVSAEAEKLLSRETEREKFLRDAAQRLKAVPTLIAGDDRQEAKMDKRDIRDGHAGTEFSRTIDGDENEAEKQNKSRAETPTAVTCAAEQESDRENGEEDVPWFENDADVDDIDGEALDDEQDTQVRSHEDDNDDDEVNERCALSPAEENWFSRPLSHWSLQDLLLVAGALVVLQLRQDVLRELGFTCSAGIAHNKMLAKLSSGMHKPNKQTLVPLSLVPRLMRDLPFSRVQGFGGKLGLEIQRAFGENVTTMHDLLTLPQSSLSRVFGEETAQWIVRRARGEDEDKVQDRALPLSIGCSKSFRQVNTLWASSLSDGTALHWLTELAKELCSRVLADSERNSRRPKSLHVGLYVMNMSEKEKEKEKAKSERDKMTSLSKVARLSFSPALSPQHIALTALALVQRAIGESSRVRQCDRWGIVSLSLAATHFEQIERGKKSITSFFAKNDQQVSENEVEGKHSREWTPSFSRERKPKVEKKKTIDVLFKEQTQSLASLSSIPPPSPSSSSSSSVCHPHGSGYPVQRREVEEDSMDDVMDLMCEESTPLRGCESNPNITSDVCVVSESESPNKMDSNQAQADRKREDSSASLTRTLFNKYIKDGDFDTFSQLPADIQQELLNEAMFRSTPSNTSTLSFSADKKTSRKRKAQSSTTNGASISKWLAK